MFVDEESDNNPSEDEENQYPNDTAIINTDDELTNHDYEEQMIINDQAEPTCNSMPVLKLTVCHTLYHCYPLMWVQFVYIY